MLTVTGHNIELNECASVDSPTTWEQQGYTSSSGDSAILETYTFTSAALASAAETGVVAGMDNCQATSRALQAANNVTPDAVCSQTAQTGDAAAFERTWTGVPGVSAGGPQINHLYVAVSGTIMLVLHFDQLNTTSSSAAIYNVRGDPGVLTMLTNLLTANAAGS